MSAYIKAADAIRDAFDCAVMVIHHCGHDAFRPRGHSSLAGAVDAQLKVDRNRADEIIVKVERMKDGPEDGVITSALETVEVGIDDDGDPITSCVIVEAEPSTQSTAIGRSLPPKAQGALDVLSEMILSSGAPAGAALNLPDGVNTVTLADWRGELRGREIIKANDTNQSTTFSRIRKNLADRGLIVEGDGLVWEGVSGQI